MNPAEFLDPLDVHHAIRRGQIILHQADLIRASRENIRFAPLGAQQRESLMQSGRTCVFERLHYAFLLSSAASTRCGINGTLGTLTPIALATALPMAAIPPMAHGSPKPTTPRLSFSSRMSMWTIISPMSPIPASL